MSRAAEEEPVTDVAARTTQLYWFETEPGDHDHLPSYYFDQGVTSTRCPCISRNGHPANCSTR